MTKPARSYQLSPYVANQVLSSSTRPRNLILSPSPTPWDGHHPPVTTEISYILSLWKQLTPMEKVGKEWQNLLLIGSWGWRGKRRSEIMQQLSIEFWRKLLVKPSYRSKLRGVLKTWVINWLSVMRNQHHHMKLRTKIPVSRSYLVPKRQKVTVLYFLGRWLISTKSDWSMR